MDLIGDPAKWTAALQSMIESVLATHTVNVTVQDNKIVVSFEVKAPK